MKRLRLSIAGLSRASRASRGTARTALEAMGQGPMARRGGRIVELEAPLRGRTDFGHGPVDTVSVSWGDVATAWHSTGAQEIDVLFEASPPLRAVSRVPRRLRPVLGSPRVQRLLSWLVDRMEPGPSAEHRRHGRCRLMAEGWDAAGARVGSLMETPEPYALTARTALAIAQRVAAGEVKPGYYTPADRLRSRPGFGVRRRPAVGRMTARAAAQFGVTDGPPRATGRSPAPADRLVRAA